jgi:O-antigen ligase
VDFFLFLLVNAALFIRPGELIPALYALPIYNVVIVMNLLVAGPALLNQLTEHNLVRSPITVCVLGVFAFVVLSHLARFDLESAYNCGVEFAKVVAYFLLLVATVNTPRRLFLLLATVVVCTLAVNVLAVLQYHGMIELATISAIADNGYGGGEETINRMRGTGIFNDPNDLSMIIVVCMIICAAGLFYKQFGRLRLALAAPLAFFFYCLTLTHSRGGMLALIAGCGVLAYCWLGAARAGLVGLVGLPVLLIGFGSRQADIGGALSGGTGRGRVELWSAGLQLLKGSPLFGVGSAQYAEHAGQVAHNSFVHAFGELGLFGGMFFLGIFAVAGWSLWSLHCVRHQIAHPGLRHMQPCLLAVVAAYCTSMMSLSQTYLIPTYMVAGLSVSYHRLAQPGTTLRALYFNGNVLKWLSAASLGFIATLYVYINVAYRG